MESPRLVRTLLGTVAALLITTVAGCGTADLSDTQHADDARATATATTSADRAAVFAVRAWVSAYNRALRSGDVVEVAHLASSCETCAELLAPIRRDRQGGNEGKAASWQVHNLRVSDRSAGSTTVTADVTATRERTAVRFVADRADPATIRELVFMVPRAAGSAASVGGSAG